MARDTASHRQQAHPNASGMPLKRLLPPRRFGLQKQPGGGPSAQQLSTIVCENLELGNCAAPLPPSN